MTTPLDDAVRWVLDAAAPVLTPVDVSLAAAVGAALAIGAVAGLCPAVRVARLAPTDALRSV